LQQKREQVQICNCFHPRNNTYKTCGCYTRTIHGNNFKKVSVSIQEPTLAELVVTTQEPTTRSSIDTPISEYEDLITQFMRIRCRVS